jgi:D-lactate dehydrogenase (quinone)
MDTLEFVVQLKDIVGRRNVLTSAGGTERYRKGFRIGEGDAEAVVIPATLPQLWRVLQACVAANRIVVMQAANTGLTGGSTPSGSYDRNVVIISTLKLDRIHLIGGGRQIISHAGGTLYQLERLLDPLGRQPHSVLGSSCVGASIVGGVCNNSGGSLIRLGPAYTELSLHAQLRADGRLELVNRLGINLGQTPEEILDRLERGDFTETDIDWSIGLASDRHYEARVREVDAESPARFNADPAHLQGASGCGGKLAVFAVRLDTFPVEKDIQIYYIGTNEPDNLTVLRRRILKEITESPISGEYMHRDCFDVSHRYGKDLLLMIHWLGTDYLPRFFALKRRLDAAFSGWRFLPDNLTDHAMQFVSRLLPEALPERLLEYRERYEHQLTLQVAGTAADATERLLREMFGDSWFLCTPREGKMALLNRFVAAGATLRCQAVHKDAAEDMIAFDIALRRNDKDWVERLPAEVERHLALKCYYGHFFCHVFHQDYIVRKGADLDLLKASMMKLFDARGAEYPAEHNVGHLYEAKSTLREHYMRCDPTNTFNPGIGKTSRRKGYA